MSASKLRRGWVALGIQEDCPDLLAAQSVALARQIPLLYLILTVNSVIISVSFGGLAPAGLTVVVPGLLCVLSIGRGIGWYLTRNDPVRGTPALVRMLRRTTVMAMVLAVIFIGWALSLYPYGTDLMRLHLAFFIVVTATGCGLCLAHLPVAAFCLLVIVVSPFSVVYILSGHPTLIAIAINSMIIYTTIVYIMLNSFKHFEAMVTSQSYLLNQNAEIARLHDQTSEIEARRRQERQADLDGIAAAFTLSIEGVTRALGDVVAHNSRQSHDVASCSDSALERLGHVTKAADGAEVALSSAAAATASLVKAIDAIRDRTSEASTISTTVESRSGAADRAMTTLDATVRRIDSIAAMIKTVAGQIDLIALNATIEAARAGRAGLGFAVVASEIKILASKTAHATDDIGRHIGDVKIASQAAHASVADMKTVFYALRSVSEQIAEALAVQTSVTNEIRTCVTSAVDGAATMRRNLADMSNSTERTQASARVMLDQCAVLGTETGVLATEVKNFLGFIKAA